MQPAGKIARRRYCPKCGTGMYPLEIENVQVDLCPKCRGMWFDAGELSRAMGLMFSDRPWAQSLATATRTSHPCPACSAPLYERQLEKGSGIMVDQCLKCKGLYLDRDEFARARQYLQRMGVPVRRHKSEARAALAQSREIAKDSPALALFQFLTALPLEVDVPQRLFPPVVIGLLAVNIAVFVLAAVNGLQATVDSFGLVPAEVRAGERLHTFFTSMFVHGGVFHLLGNMYFLYVTGDNVEERFGWYRFLGFYLLCGLVASLAHVVAEPASRLPCVGASGAISGVIGAYVVLFPRNRFLMRWFYFLWHHVSFELPAWAYFGFWVALQTLYAALDLPGVAWWAHIAGFACGAGVAMAARRL